MKKLFSIPRSIIAVLVALLAGGHVQGQTAAAPRVTLASGSLEGLSAGGVESFKGIPFAAPPIGDLRWRAPQPVAPWTGVRSARAYGNDCAQLDFPNEVAPDAAPSGAPTSEDCLYANVWRPAASSGRLPVLVWIYGGGFVNGGASAAVYDGSAMARQGILFFSFNYRLGRFGTFAHPQLSRERSADNPPANYNHMDQIQALRWVKQNIAAFGGDPTRVTIVGESAGARSIHTLMTSPETEGLFSRAVIQSGGVGDNVYEGTSLDSLERLGVAFGQSKGISADDPGALAKLRGLPAQAIIDGLSLATYFMPGADPTPLRTFGRTIADGTVAVDSLAAYRQGKFRQVPVMVGATSDDLGGKTGYMTVGARQVARLVSQAGLPAYYYRFSYVADAVRTPTTRGAAHASDIAFFFSNADQRYGAKTMPRDRSLGQRASSYLVNFVKTGNPNGPNLTTWPTYSQQTEAMMDFTETGLAASKRDPWTADLDEAANRLANTR